MGLVGIKYNASPTNPFDGHMDVLVMFLLTMFVYVIALTVTSTLIRSTSQQEEEDTNTNHSIIILKLICHVCGVVGHTHNVYGYLIGLLLTLLGIKFNSSSCTNNPFFDGDHMAIIMFFFLETVFVYVIALTVTSRLSSEDDTTINNVLKLICHVSGGIGCELLLFILVTPLYCFIINVVLGGILLLLLLICVYANSMSTEEQEIRETEMEDIQPAARGNIPIHNVNN
ncbi:putative transmembrane protein [Senna tora]|uniref:Putative transmembrane protein n=1 Tax=Senna tora TaxID=362788 RepID=A0A834WB59_9FABA|nr:putative transmembrane protein [Senna tora]